MGTQTKPIEQAYRLAKERYAALGVNTDRVLRQLAKVPVSLHCWQGDDVGGFENDLGLTGGGIQATGKILLTAMLKKHNIPEDKVEVVVAGGTDARGEREEVHAHIYPNMPAIEALAKAANIALADVSEVVHGTTLVTNAIIERSGAALGLLAQARDALVRERVQSTAP